MIEYQSSMGSSDKKLVKTLIYDKYNFWATHELTAIRFKRTLPQWYAKSSWLRINTINAISLISQILGIKINFYFASTFILCALKWTDGRGFWNNYRNFTDYLTWFHWISKHFMRCSFSDNIWRLIMNFVLAGWILRMLWPF